MDLSASQMEETCSLARRDSNWSPDMLLTVELRMRMGIVYRGGRGSEFEGCAAINFAGNIPSHHD